jgi:hypothetical protein
MVKKRKTARHPAGSSSSGEKIKASWRLTYGTVQESPRTVIYALRIEGVLLEPLETEHLAARMRERLAQRGETMAEVVVVQGNTKETLRLYGMPYSTNRVRAAMFNAAIRWLPIDLS